MTHTQLLLDTLLVGCFLLMALAAVLLWHSPEFKNLKKSIQQEWRRKTTK